MNKDGMKESDSWKPSQSIQGLKFIYFLFLSPNSPQRKMRHREVNDLPKGRELEKAERSRLVALTICCAVAKQPPESHCWDEPQEGRGGLS